jgi:hypothetical protein
MPDRELVPVESHHVSGGPSHLLVGGGEGLAQLGPGDGAADGQMHVLPTYRWGLRR